MTTTTTSRDALLTPDQAVQAQRLAAAQLEPRAIAAILEVPEDRVLRSFHQRATGPIASAPRVPQITLADLAEWGLDDDCEPFPLEPTP